MRDFLVPGIVIGVIVAISGAVQLSTKLSCDAWAEATGRKTYWTFSGGCFVTMQDGQVLPRDVAESVLRKQYSAEIKQR